MAITDILAVTATFVFCGLALWYVISVQLIVVYPRLTRGKGYPPPIAHMVIASCVWLGVSLFALLCQADVLERYIENGVYRTLGYGLVAAGFICALPLAFTACLSQQETRKSGPRRALFPYRQVGGPLAFLGWTLFLILPIGDAVLRGFKWSNERQLFLSFLGLLVGACMLAVGEKFLDAAKRANLPDPLEVLRGDKRPPVLFLRGFRYDKELFIDVNLGSPDPQGGIPAAHIRETFEQFFGKPITTRLGPFLALGNPEDYLPPSDAATRIYLSDMEWFDWFQEFARDSTCILLRVSTSDNLDQELRFILSTGLQIKLYILTPPEFYDLGKNDLISVNLNRLSFSWPEFAEMLNRLGYSAPEDDMPNGAVIGFDSEGKAEVVLTDAKSATDYIGAIESRIPSKI